MWKGARRKGPRAAMAHPTRLKNAASKERLLCETQPAPNEEGECSRQYVEQIKDTGNPGLETRRCFCSPLHRFVASRRRRHMNVATPNGCPSPARRGVAHPRRARALL